MVLTHDFERNPELTNAQLEVFSVVTPHTQYTEDFDAVVERVHDGDTVTLSTDERDFLFPLRLLDIDAPELSEGGDVAKAYLMSRVLGQRVTIRINKSNRVGKYGRLLGKIEHGGMDLGEEMLSLGLVSQFGAKNEGMPEPVTKIFREDQWFQ